MNKEQQFALSEKLLEEREGKLKTVKEEFWKYFDMIFESKILEQHGMKNFKFESTIMEYEDILKREFFEAGIMAEKTNQNI